MAVINALALGPNLFPAHSDRIVSGWLGARKVGEIPADEVDAFLGFSGIFKGDAKILVVIATYYFVMINHFTQLRVANNTGRNYSEFQRKFIV